MLTLPQIASHFRKVSHHKILPYPSINRLTTFILEPVTKLYIILNCTSKHFTDNKEFYITNYEAKTPLEMVDEAFYYHRSHYYVKGVRAQKLEQLMAQFNLNPLVENKIDGLERMQRTVRVSKEKNLYSALSKTFKDFQKVYTTIMKDPSEYFIVSNINSDNSTSDDRHKIRNKIYNLMIKR